MQEIKKAAPEGAADEKVCQIHDTMPEAVEQAVESFKAGITALRHIVNVVAIQCYLGNELEVQVNSAQDLEHLPGELSITQRPSEEYPFELAKTVNGIDFICLERNTPMQTVKVCAACGRPLGRMMYETPTGDLLHPDEKCLAEYMGAILTISESVIFSSREALYSAQTSNP